MDKIITIKIHSQDFDVKVSDEYVMSLFFSMNEDFDLQGNNKRIDLLRAYCKSVHSLYLQDIAIEAITSKIDVFS
ncbi:hypothetical protein [Candidatus Sulfurimonas baltica]|uniref:Uncharacterized protein n=1 Tax=Candidatus Sulfurimonas baltica TaxID=2740404 RepID=A0A7S7RM45_9BACT|nr:hypothetical protein [Candidatus Sulfurimonas baltica]QOY50940.1 hypothetical protein HUE88_07225 [Candidatus Sulfurimonas baltica]